MQKWQKQEGLSSCAAKRDLNIQAKQNVFCLFVCFVFHTRTKCYSLAQVSKMLMHPFIHSPPFIPSFTLMHPFIHSPPFIPMHPFIHSPPFIPSFTLKPENDPLFPAASSNESKLVKWHADLLVKSPHSLAVALYVTDMSQNAWGSFSELRQVQYKYNVLLLCMIQTWNNLYYTCQPHLV